MDPIMHKPRGKKVKLVIDLKSLNNFSREREEYQSVTIETFVGFVSKKVLQWDEE
jgi:hypothetical protein